MISADGNEFKKSGNVSVSSFSLGNVADYNTILGIIFFFQFFLIVDWNSCSL